MEDFFLRMNFELQTNPTLVYGIERHAEVSKVNEWIVQHRHEIPDFHGLFYIRKIHSCERQTDMVGPKADYFIALADTYLDWLYGFYGPHTRG